MWISCKANDRSLLYLDICKSESLVCRKIQKSFNCPAYICLFSSTGPLSCTLYSAYLQHFKVCRENKKVLHVFVGFPPLALSAITKFTWQRPVWDFVVYGKDVPSPLQFDRGDVGKGRQNVCGTPIPTPQTTLTVYCVMCTVIRYFSGWVSFDFV